MVLTPHTGLVLQTGAFGDTSGLSSGEEPRSPASRQRKTLVSTPGSVVQSHTLPAVLVPFMGTLDCGI